MIEQRRTIHHMRDREIRLMPIAPEPVFITPSMMGTAFFWASVVCFIIVGALVLG